MEAKPFMQFALVLFTLSIVPSVGYAHGSCPNIDGNYVDLMHSSKYGPGNIFNDLEISNVVEAFIPKNHGSQSIINYGLKEKISDIIIAEGSSGILVDREEINYYFNSIFRDEHRVGRSYSRRGDVGQVYGNLEFTKISDFMEVGSQSLTLASQDLGHLWSINPETLTNNVASLHGLDPLNNDGELVRSTRIQTKQFLDERENREVRIDSFGSKFAEQSSKTVTLACSGSQKESRSSRSSVSLIGIEERKAGQTYLSNNSDLVKVPDTGPYYTSFEVYNGHLKTMSYEAELFGQAAPYATLESPSRFNVGANQTKTIYAALRGRAGSTSELDLRLRVEPDSSEQSITTRKTLKFQDDPDQEITTRQVPGITLVEILVLISAGAAFKLLS